MNITSHAALQGDVLVIVILSTRPYRSRISQIPTSRPIPSPPSEVSAPLRESSCNFESMSRTGNRIYSIAAHRAEGLAIGIAMATSTFHRGWQLTGDDADSSAQQLRAAAAVALAASVTARPVFVAARRPRRQLPGECLEPGPHHDPARAELTARAACVTPRGPLIVQALVSSGAEDNQHDGAAQAAAAWAVSMAT